MPARARVRVEPLTVERWPDLERLFGPRGACAGCWCMWWRLPAAEFRRNRGDGNRRALRRLAGSGEPPGLIAYAGGEPAGWIALAPRESYTRFERSRVLAPVDAEPVWSVTCFFVARPHRHHGLADALLEAAVKHAARRGARWLEGYPVDTGAKRAPDTFVWSGLPGPFRRAGFIEVARRTPTRPILRRRLRPGRPAARRAGTPAAAGSRVAAPPVRRAGAAPRAGARAGAARG